MDDVELVSFRILLYAQSISKNLSCFYEKKLQRDFPSESRSTLKHLKIKTKITKIRRHFVMLSEGEVGFDLALAPAYLSLLSAMYKMHTPWERINQ